MNLGMGGAGFSPSAMDAYSALLGRVPSMIDESLARKRAKAAGELKGGELDRRIKKETYEKATGPQLGSDPNAGPEGRLAAMRREAEMSRLSAQMGRAPTKTTYVGTSPGFEEVDPNAMNAYQRELFLPKEAGYDRGQADNDQVAAKKKAAEEEDFRKRREIGFNF